LSCLSGGALKSHIPSSAAADAAKIIAHTTASGLRFREISEPVNIEQHKLLISAPQPGSITGRSSRVACYCHQDRELNFGDKKDRQYQCGRFSGKIDCVT
jgi:hypothetical protein